MSLKIRLRAVSHRITWMLGTRFPETFPFVFVVGFPRSGTTWTCQLLAECLELPFPRYSLLPVGCPAVVHGHEPMRRHYPRAAYVLRDGRDVMVSDYFQLTRPIPEGDHPPLTSVQRLMFPGLINKADIKRNLPAFIERQLRKPASSKLNWSQHVQSYFEVANRNAVLLRYEDLIHDARAALGKAAEKLAGTPIAEDVIERALEKYSFTRQSGRQTGQEDRSAFLRRGQTGDWKNHFSREAAQVFDRRCGEMLIRTGYEANRQWISSCLPLKEFQTLEDPAPSDTSPSRTSASQL